MTDGTTLTPADYCAWWVIVGGSGTRSSNRVHVPKAVRDGGGNDPDEEPPAVTLCHYDSRTDNDLRTKSHAVLPPGYRDLCRSCQSKLAEVVGDE